MKIKYILYALILIILVYYGYGYFTTEISTSGRIVIAHDKWFHPTNLLGRELDIEIFCEQLIEKIAKEQKLDISFETVSYEQLDTGLETKKYDAILIPVKEESPHSYRYYYSEPLFSLAPTLVVREGEAQNTLVDFKGAQIGIAITNTDLGKLNSIPQITISTFNRDYDVMDALLQEKIDGAVLEALHAFAYAEGYYKGRVRIIQPALDKAGIQFVTLRNAKNNAFITSFNKGLIEFYEKGEYQKLLDHWGFINYPVPPFLSPHPLSLEKP